MNSFCGKAALLKKWIFGVLGGALLCIVLASCENFIRGAETKRQLEDAIAYANAKSCTLYLKSEPAMGSFLAEGGVTCKVGFSTELQFTLKKDDYHFISLKAVSSTNETKSRADCVEFTVNEKDSDIEKGIYKINVKLVKDANDILIKPDCVELPCITKYTPQTDTPQYANTPITVFFNFPVEEENITAKNSLFNYTNITFKTTDYSGKEKDMSSYFYRPEFNKEKTVLKIVPKTSELKTYMNDPGDHKPLNFIDIQVSFSEKITIKNNDCTLPLKQDSNSSFNIRYNSESEDITAPTKAIFYATKETIVFSSAPSLNGTSSILQKNPLVWDKKDTNLVPSTFYIFGKYYDIDSGVRSVKVTEKYVMDMFGVGKSGTLNERTYYEDSDNIIFEDNGDGYRSFIITYNMQESVKAKPNAGFFDITVNVNDGCDISSTSETFQVIYLEYGDLSYNTKYKKDASSYSEYSNSGKFSVYNTPFTKSTENPDKYDLASYYSDIKKIRIMDEYMPIRFHILGAMQNYLGAASSDITFWLITGDYVKYYCEYIDKTGAKRTEPFSNYIGPEKERFVVLDIDDNVAGVTFTVIAEYNGVKIGRKQFSFPSALTFSGIGTNFITPIPNSELYLGGLIVYDNSTYDFLYLDKVQLENQTYVNSISLINLPQLSQQAQQITMYTGNISCLAEPVATTYDYTYSASQSRYISKKTTSTAMIYSTSTEQFSSKNQRYGDVLFGEMVGPFKKNQSATSIGSWTLPAVDDIKISNKNGYYDLYLSFQENLWQIFDTLIINGSEFTKNDFDVDETKHKVIITFPVKNTDFYSKDAPAPKKLKISGRKGLVVSNEKEMTVSLTEEQMTKLDNIKPANLYIKTLTDENKMIVSFYDNGSGPKSGRVWLNDSLNPVVLQKNDVNNHFEAAIPIKNFIYGSNTLRYELKDNKTNENNGSLTINTTSYYLGHNRCMKTNTTTDTSRTITFESPCLRDVYNAGDSNTLKIFTFDKNSKKWSLYKEIIKDNITKNGDNYSTEAVTILSPDFIRVAYKPSDFNNSYYKDDTIMYTKTYKGTGKSNYIIANGSSKKSFVIASDAPVYVHVCFTYKTLAVCSAWTVDKWELWSSSAFEEELVFDLDSKPQVYSFEPISEQMDMYNNMCYCVIAHYADGTTGISQIFEKR